MASSSNRAWKQMGKYMWLWGCCLMCLLALPDSARSSIHTLQDIRKALATGDMVQMEAALKRYEKEVHQQAPKMTSQAKDNAALWTALMWAQYHQVKGAPPSFMRLQEYETQQQVQDQIRVLERAIPHLEAAVRYLQSYTRRFRRMMRRANVRDQLALLSTTSRIGILENSLRAIQNRIPHLEQLLRMWGRESPAQRKQRLRRLMELINRGQRSLKQVRKRQDVMALQLRRQSQAIAQSQKVLLQHQMLLQNKARQGKRLILIGVGLAIAGVGVVGLGIGLAVLQADFNACNVACSNQLDVAVPSALVVGGALLAGSLVFVVVGVMQQPGERQFYQGVYRSQKKYLEWDKRKPLRSQTTRQQAPTPPLAHATRVLWSGSL